MTPTDKSQACVNIGCGTTPTPGWINFDNSMSLRLSRSPVTARLLSILRLPSQSQRETIEFHRTSGVRWANAVKRIPMENESVRCVYTSHMVEHLDPSEFRAFLAEARRVLAPGGILRIGVPDLRLLVDEYLRAGDANHFIESTLLTASRPIGLIGAVKALIVGPRHHLWMYDGPSISKELEANHFVDVLIVPAGETTCADPGELNLFERAHQTVYVEATRV